MAKLDGGQLLIHSAGLLLLTPIFVLLMLLVQRSEKNRRLASFIIMLGVGSVVSSFGIYRISRECALDIAILCRDPGFLAKQVGIAYATVNTSVVLAFVISFLFWALIGRYNPPGTSEDIKVLGLKD